VTAQVATAFQNSRLVQRLDHESRHDPLTGLANRALLLDRIDHALATSRRDPKRKLALLYLDLDDFKTVNDRFGHHAGDQLLRLVAERLRGCVRAEDTVARFAGDEFVILVEDESDTEEVSQVARRVLKHFNAPFELADERVKVNPSIGIAADFTGFEEPHDLLRQADRAMYEAKRRGTGGYVVATTTQTAIPEFDDA
jgi:diguanylate cyclase (GGDEF)-like protein